MTTDYMGRTYRSPLFINAFNGGTRLSEVITGFAVEWMQQRGLDPTRFALL